MLIDREAPGVAGKNLTRITSVFRARLPGKSRRASGSYSWTVPKKKTDELMSVLGRRLVYHLFKAPGRRQGKRDASSASSR